MTQAKHVRRPNHQAPAVSGDDSFKFAAVRAAPAPTTAKLIFSTETEPCSEDTVIASRNVCEAAASALGYLDNTDNAVQETDLSIHVGTLGPEYEKGCLVNGKNAFFSETSPGDKGVQKTDKYICKVHGEYQMTNKPCEEAGLHSINSAAVCKEVSEGNSFEYEGPAGADWQQGCLFKKETRRSFYSDAPDATESGQKAADAYFCASTSVSRPPGEITTGDTTHNLNSEDNIMDKIIMPGSSDCFVVNVGSSGAKTKNAKVDDVAHICPKTISKKNWIGQNYDSVSAYERYNDEFSVVQTGVDLVVTRSDTVAEDPSGWTLDLKFVCCWKGGPAYNTVIEQDNGAK